MNFSGFKKFFLRHREKFYFSVLSFVILAPLLKPGFVLTLDMIFTPNMNFTVPPVNGLYSFVPLDSTLFVLAKIIPADVLQKLILLLLFYLIPFGFFKFLSIIKKEDDGFVLKLLASTLYLWNPFVYSRVMAGHWTFLFGYALLPFFIYHLSSAYTSPNNGKRQSKVFWKNVFYTTLLSPIITIFSPHHLAFIGIIFLIYSFIKIVSRAKGNFRKFLALASAQILIHSLWIVPTIISQKARISFGEKDLLAFASSPDSSLGTFLNLVTMYGFWAEKTLFYLPKLITPFWPLPFFVLLMPIILLLFTYLPERLRRIFALRKEPFREYRAIVLLSFLTGLIGLILSLGPLGIAKPVFDFFYTKLGVLNAFREPQKFLSLYIFGFCFLFFLGMKIWVEQIRYERLKSLDEFRKEDSSKIRKVLGKSVIAGFFMLIFTLTYTFFWGAVGQLKTARYPESYAELQRITKGRDSKILVLPFNSYDLFPFNNRRIADPAPKYFDAEVFSNVEISRMDCDVYIDPCLNRSDPIETWGNNLKYSGIGYILVNKTSGFQSYAFLGDSRYSEKIFEDDFAYILKLSPK